MRRRLILLVSIGLTLAVAARAETTRTLRATLTADVGARFAVENLAGAMTVTATDGDTVVAVATVHAETEALAGEMRFEQVRGEEGVPTLRVIYPLDSERTIRYPNADSKAEDDHHHGRHNGVKWFFSFGFDSSGIRYDGRRVRVSDSRGTLLYADVEIQVPRRALDATFRNFVGNLRAEGIEGRILLDTTRGDITARHVKGNVKADTGSGEVLAETVAGSFTCDTGSGACIVTGFDGDLLSCDTGSGRVRIRDAHAVRLVGDTGSGRIVVERSDVEEFSGDTGSGGIEAELMGSRLRRVNADTGSGSVNLRLPADASFDLAADQGSGSLHCGYRDAEAVIHGREVVGYRRGDGKVRISIDTGSGSATIDPIR